ncbi:hypothetical protein QBC38DRAFT_57928 [Podospora fimiseda]|uniref:Uncharacterized protein n=1 Tax=Podospora fimiseda TaxID=252190 RepID=A0AAN7BH33_9PEZI|nr:hypothetical protein QBC38DRAFT_57928 [Podospora fimiseda]
MIRPTTTIFNFSLFLFTVVFAEQDDEQQHEQKIGWENNPTRRGTLKIIYQCLATIFVCTWTVLHLNVPAVGDSAWTRGVRQAKWMGINVLFPEFLFAKGVCDLRFALFGLGRLRGMEGGFVWREVVDGRGDGRFLRGWKWTVEGGSRMERLLCWLLLVPRGEVGTLEHNKGDGELYQEIVERKVEGYFLEERVWTLTHSYYVNMGGILAPGVSGGGSKGRSGRRLHWEKQPKNLEVIRGDDLTVHSDDPHSNGTHPLKQFELSREDIEDKSKSDWIAKTIAVCQISWLVLDVATRRQTGLPLTQLEVATLSFSALAVCTYAVNWSKPRNILQPTILRLPTLKSRKDYRGHQVHSFMSRLWYPSSENPALDRLRDDRVSNDFVWMDGEVPLIWTLLAVSSPFFGGLHCLAWYFEFPTNIEKTAWRVASVVSGALPAVSLVVALILSFVSRSFNDQKCASAIHLCLEKLEQFPASWWTLIEQRPAALRWETPSWSVFLTSGPRDWNTKPTYTGAEQLSKEQKLSMKQRKTQFETIWERIRQFQQNCLAFEEGSVQPRLLSGDRQTNEAIFFYAKHLQLQVSGWSEEIERNGSELWRSYELHLRGLLTPRERARLPKGCCRDYIISKVDEIERHLEKAKKVRRVCDQAARFVGVICGGLYIAARLVILGIIFSSLRAVPEGVYQSTNWTRYMPTWS